LKEAVVDASVAVKWVVEEKHSAQATLLLNYDALHAPAHWRAEAANALWAKVFRGDLTAADAEERLLVLNRATVPP
jgi:predicted nucleic acid-binding protein